jgi:hypothetical protein
MTIDDKCAGSHNQSSLVPETIYNVVKRSAAKRRTPQPHPHAVPLHHANHRLPKLKQLPNRDIHYSFWSRPAEGRSIMGLDKHRANTAKCDGMRGQIGQAGNERTRCGVLPIHAFCLLRFFGTHTGNGSSVEQYCLCGSLVGVCAFCECARWKKKVGIRICQSVDWDY